MAMQGLALVTGANGHVGYNLVRALTARGVKVRASVRNKDDPNTAGPLKAMDGVEVVSIDVTDRQAFEAAAKGVDTLFHVAATYKIFAGGQAGEAQMLRDSVDGAGAAIGAAAKAGVRRVVLTSSIVTLPSTRPGEASPTEADWRSDLTIPYYRAKVMAEREAWKLAKEHKVDLVTVLPGFVIGPPFLRRTTSLDIIYGIMLGIFRLGTFAVSLSTPVDVRDLVEGHILAAEKGREGRFLIANDQTYTYRDLSRMMHRIDPKVPAAPFVLPDFLMRFTDSIDWFNHATLGAPRTYTTESALNTAGTVLVGSNARARSELGWTPKIPFEQSLAETMAALRDLAASERARPH
jgi:dihydroflavonol-4-reductase